MNDAGRENRGGSGGAPEDAMDADAAFQKAADLLTLRPHFRAELAAKLAKRRFHREATDAALDRLERAGYLDDLETARGFARERVERRHWGPQRLRAELSRRGVADSVSRQVVGERFVEGDRAAARAAAESWRRKGGKGSQRLAGYLGRRGFSKGSIVEILRTYGSATESEHEEF